MLVVDPEHRGFGLGRALTDECIIRARHERAPGIALHTSPIMEVALAMYLKMGFEKYSSAPQIQGVEYAVYKKHLECSRSS